MAGVGGTGSVGRAAKTVVKYGVKYGPIVFEAVKLGKDPAKQAVQKAWHRRTARRRALQHAASVLDGSVLRTFHLTEPVWVVYSGETPVASHPVVDTSLDALVRHADLSTRIRPGDGRRRADHERRG